MLASCKPLDPCLKEEDFNIKLGDTVFVKACDENAEIYSWQINKEPINTFLNPPNPFFNHYADSGGTPCDPFVSVIFHDTGNFKIRCVFGKISNGNCSDDLPMSESEFLNAKVYVKDTAR